MAALREATVEDDVAKMCGLEQDFVPVSNLVRVGPLPGMAVESRTRSRIQNDGRPAKCET